MVGKDIGIVCVRITYIAYQFQLVDIPSTNNLFNNLGIVQENRAMLVVM